MLQASMAGSRDTVIDVQQAMVHVFSSREDLFESQNTVPHGLRMQEAETHSDS